MPMEGDEEDDEEEGYWRSQQQGSEDGSDDEEYTPQARSPKEVISCLSTLSQLPDTSCLPLRDCEPVHSSLHSSHLERVCNFTHTAIKVLLQAASSGIKLC